jgi:hypothetical protein
MANSGTIRSLTIDGVTYDVPADINITFNISSFETEGVATTGRTVFKKTRRVPTQEGVVVMTTPEEMVALKKKAESLAEKTFSVELADGSVFKTAGEFNYENVETEENRSSIVIIPNKCKDAWTEFLA